MYLLEPHYFEEVFIRLFLKLFTRIICCCCYVVDDVNALKLFVGGWCVVEEK